MTHTENYERHAEAFYEQTRFIAPGKSVPSEMAAEQDDEQRRQAWNLWMGRPREDCVVCKYIEKREG